jgi:hypothetical protein
LLLIIVRFSLLPNLLRALQTVFFVTGAIVAYVFPVAFVFTFILFNVPLVAHLTVTESIAIYSLSLLLYTRDVSIKSLALVFLILDFCFSSKMIVDGFFVDATVG